jgi:hypothetical protein
MFSTPPGNATVIPLSLGKVWIDEYGFCRIRVVGGINHVIGEREILELADAVYEACEGKKRKHLIDSTFAYGKVDPAAIAELGRNEKLISVRSAAAMIIDNGSIKKVMMNYIRTGNPAYPYACFDNEQEAVVWLSSL